MDAATIYQRFVDKAPAALLVHGLLRACLAPEFLDAVAEPHLPRSPHPRQLDFSQLVEILLPVVFASAKSVRHAYRRATHLHAVATLQCVYERLGATPPAAAAALVQAVAERVAPLFDPPPAGAARLLTLDGNRLAATQSRLADLAGLPAALPGQAAVLRDRATGVSLRVPLHEDAHAKERSLHPRLPDWFGPGDVVIADGSFCTAAFLAGARGRGARSVVRRHGGVGLTPLGARLDGGRVAAGRLYETAVRCAGTAPELRLVEVELDKPTRDGHAVAGILTDVPAGAMPAADVAATSLGRRTIETAFQELAEGLRGEVETLAYPKAALLAFGLAAAVYNLLRVAQRAAERPAGPAAGAPAAVSPVLLGQEVSSFGAGLAAALDGNPMVPAADGSADRLRAWVGELARRLVGGRYAKSKRGHRKQKPAKSKSPKGSHTATARVLDQRRIRSQ